MGLLAMETLRINTFIFIFSVLLICEASGECSHGQWECGSGDCIVRENVCNSKVDCGDGSDESNCKTESCDVFLFQCADKKQCVSRVTVCNGKLTVRMGVMRSNLTVTEKTLLLLITLMIDH